MQHGGKVHDVALFKSWLVDVARKLPNASKFEDDVLHRYTLVRWWILLSSSTVKAAYILWFPKPRELDT